MTPESKIEELVQAFVAKVTALARETAMATLTAQLAPGSEAEPQRRTAVRTPRGASPAGTRRPKKGAKRAAADIARLEGVLAKHIEKHPGQRVEQINKVLRTKTNDVRLPLAKLIEAGTVKTKGNRRATQYFQPDAGQPFGDDLRVVTEANCVAVPLATIAAGRLPRGDGSDAGRV